MDSRTASLVAGPGRVQVNMMDLRAGKETESWFFDAFDYVKRFVAEGGYRLYPAEVSVPGKIRNGKPAAIIHKWSNAGWGYCPNNIKQWNYKYKVAFALIDGNGNTAATFIDMDSDPSEWLKGNETSYEFQFVPENIQAGKYTLAAGIVDTSKEGNPIGIELAVDKSRLTAEGWAVISEVLVR